MLQSIAALLLAFGVSVCGMAQKQPDNQMAFPAPNWESIKNPGERGWNEDKLKKLRGYIIDSCNTTGMLVIQRGDVVFQYGNVADNSYLASCRKSVLSMLYGPFVANGTIQLDKTIEALQLDDIGGLLPIEKKATIRHLLTARSGVYHKASNEGDASAMAPKRGTVQPGSFWLYNNWDFNIAGHILEKETGKNIYDLVDSLLAKPLQMQDWNRKIQQKHGDLTRSKYPAYHMWFSTRDMARLGHLMLNNGNWNGKPVLSASWVKTTTTVVTPYREGLANKTNHYEFGYGYLWWIWDAPGIRPQLKGAYTATGAFGQFITVIPDMDVVIAHKTNYNDYQRNTSTDTYLRIVDKVIDAYVKP